MVAFTGAVAKPKGDELVHWANRLGRNPVVKTIVRAAIPLLHLNAYRCVLILEVKIVRSDQQQQQFRDLGCEFQSKFCHWAIEGAWTAELRCEW